MDFIMFSERIENVFPPQINKALAASENFLWLYLIHSQHFHLIIKKKGWKQHNWQHYIWMQHVFLKQQTRNTILTTCVFRTLISSTERHLARRAVVLAPVPPLLPHGLSTDRSCTTTNQRQASARLSQSAHRRGNLILLFCYTKEILQKKNIVYIN